MILFIFQASIHVDCILNNLAFTGQFCYVLNTFTYIFFHRFIINNGKYKNVDHISLANPNANVSIHINDLSSYEVHPGNYILHVGNTSETVAFHKPGGMYSALVTITDNSVVSIFFFNKTKYSTMVKLIYFRLLILMNAEILVIFIYSLCYLKFFSLLWDL